jgi:hypothetical protein
VTENTTPLRRPQLGGDVASAYLFSIDGGKSIEIPISTVVTSETTLYIGSSLRVGVEIDVNALHRALSSAKFSEYDMSEKNRAYRIKPFLSHMSKPQILNRRSQCSF